MRKFVSDSPAEQMMLEKFCESEVSTMEDYIGKHEQNVSVFDAIHAELLGEKVSRREKFMRNHYIRNDGKPIRKDKRKSYRKELCYTCDPWIGFGVVKHKRERDAVESRIADWEIEQANHAEQVRKINRLVSFASDIAEWLEPVDDWFMDDDIGNWTYADGELCHGAKCRIDERQQYIEEIGWYTAESNRLSADEEYYRKQKSFGVRADLYLKSLRSPWDFE